MLIFWVKIFKKNLWKSLNFLPDTINLNIFLDLTDFIRKLFQRMPNSIWQNRSDEIASQCYVPCQDCGALRVIKLSHTFHFNFLSHITTFCWKFCQQQGFFQQNFSNSSFCFLLLLVSILRLLAWIMLRICNLMQIDLRWRSHLYGMFLERKKITLKMSLLFSKTI